MEILKSQCSLKSELPIFTALHRLLNAVREYGNFTLYFTTKYSKTASKLISVLKQNFINMCELLQMLLELINEHCCRAVELPLSRARDYYSVLRQNLCQVEKNLGAGCQKCNACIFKIAKK